MDKEEIPIPILIEDLGMMYATKDSKYKHRFGLYICGFCGTEFRARTSCVKFGNTNSCGCYQKQKVSESNKKHGMIDTRLYGIWRGMKKRTTNIHLQEYTSYGGRGITVCEEWKNDFMSFHDWAMSNGYSDELSLDRIDNDGNYEPSNCRWTTQIIQTRNRRIRKDNKTGYKGLSFIKDNNSFSVTISVNKKRINLGRFKTAVEGAIAYNNYIIENNLEGFILNEIPKEQ